MFTSVKNNASPWPINQGRGNAEWRTGLGCRCYKRQTSLTRRIDFLSNAKKQKKIEILFNPFNLLKSIELEDFTGQSKNKDTKEHNTEQLVNTQM